MVPAGESFAYILQRGNRSPLLHVFFAFFAAFTLFMAFYHVPWRDEAQTWLFARDLDWPGLFYITRYNGHPLLWMACVKVIYQLGLGFSATMLLNWALCVWGIWLLYYRSGLPLAARIAFAYAPECMLEISYTARDYAPAIPLCFLAATLYRKVEVHPLRFSIVLALLASTNVFAAVVFVGISFQFLLEQAYGFGSHNFSLRGVFTRYLVPNLILVLGAILLVLELAPIRFPGDHFPSVTSHLDVKPSRLIDLRVALTGLPWLVLFLLPKSPSHPRILAGIPILLLVSVPIIAYAAFARHFFMLSLGVVYFCWVYFDNFLRVDSPLTRKFGAQGVACLITLLVLIAGYGVKPYPRLGYPGLMDGRNAAYAILNSNLDRPGTLLVSTDPFRTMSLLPYLKSIRADYVPSLFGPSPQSFVAPEDYFKCADVQPPVAEIRPLVVDLAQKNPGKTILVVGTAPEPEIIPDYGPRYHLDLLYASPDRGWHTSEGYYVYILRDSAPERQP